MSGSLSEKVRGKGSVGENIYIKHSYLSILLAATPARQQLQYLESKAQAFFLSLTYYNLTNVKKKNGWRNRQE